MRNRERERERNKTMPIDDIGTHTSGPNDVTTLWIPVSVLIGSHSGDRIGRANGDKERSCVFVFFAVVFFKCGT
jgi:hypothetical protein